FLRRDGILVAGKSGRGLGSRGALGGGGLVGGFRGRRCIVLPRRPQCCCVLGIAHCHGAVGAQGVQGGGLVQDVVVLAVLQQGHHAGVDAAVAVQVRGQCPDILFARKQELGGLLCLGLGFVGRLGAFGHELVRIQQDVLGVQGGGLGGDDALAA